MIDMPSRGMKSCVSLVTAVLVLASASPNREAQAQPTPDSQEAESYPQMGKSREIMLGPDTWFRFGLQAQTWLNYQQSPNRVDDEDGGYAFDMFVRRARLIVVAQFLKNLSAFFMVDSPNLGRTAVTTVGEDTVVSKGFAPAVVQDLFATLKVAGDAFTIEGGLFIPGFSANGMQSTTGYRGLDVAAVAAVVAQTATSVLRDVGLQLKGYLVGDHLEYRLAVLSGLRQGADGADPAGRNAPLVSGRLQYHLFDTEKGYVYSGYTFGKKKFLAVGGGFQFQKASDVAGESLDAYSALSAGVWGNWPLSGEASPTGGDELAFIGEFYRYDGGETFANIAEQNDFLVEAAYYNKGANASVFARFEMQQFADDAVGESGAAGNKRWFGGGIKYFLAENSFNFTLAYQRVQYPDADGSAVNDTNQFTLQMQAFYF